MMKKILFLTILLYAGNVVSQTKEPVNAVVLHPTGLVNVFLGASGDHGQMSPGACYPFSMLSICPETYPKLHMGYEHKAKICIGFTHNRFEGVGCQGSGGNILIKPFANNNVKDNLIKSTETAGPGWYNTSFANGIQAKFAVTHNQGIENYYFPGSEKNGFLFDLSHTLANRFVDEAHRVSSHSISGWIESATTCNVGIYRVYYDIIFDKPVIWEETQLHRLLAHLTGANQAVTIRVALSSVDTLHAEAAIGHLTYAQTKAASTHGWDQVLSRAKVYGDKKRQKLFYSLLYRTVQSPYVISEPDGAYRNTNGELLHTTDTVYNGWSIWDNYRTQLPLLSVLYPDRYKHIATSIANLYRFGKKNYATKHEPSNTVRTEHAVVVLLDAYRKGYIRKASLPMDSLVAENLKLDYSHPDKALESSYDSWALGELFTETGDKITGEKYKQKALAYKQYWDKDFKDLTKPDVDRIPARNLYQGTIWQYRWL